jgi:hypothetical protein
MLIYTLLSLLAALLFLFRPRATAPNNDGREAQRVVEVAGAGRPGKSQNRND